MTPDLISQHRRIRAVRKTDRVPQRFECYCCGRPVSGDCPMRLIDNHTEEVLNPTVPGNFERGNFWPIGADCWERINR